MKKSNLFFFNIIALFTILLSVNAYSLSNYEASFIPINNEIYEDEIATYQLIIKNNADFEEIFVSPYATDIDWSVKTEPLLYKLAPQSTKTINVTLNPNQGVSPGSYGVIIVVKSAVTEELKKYMVEAYIKPLKPVQQTFRPSVALNVDVPNEVDPKEPFIAKIYLRNRNALIINDAQLIFKSELINYEYNFTLNSLEERSEEIIFNFDPLQAPITDSLTVELIGVNESINSIKTPFRIVPYSNLIINEEFKSFFFKTTNYVKIKNDGNIVNKETYKVPKSFLASIFTYSPSDSRYEIINGKRYLVFDLNIGPDKEASLQYTTNYRIIIYITLLVLILIGVYYYLRSPITTSKEAFTDEIGKDGVSEIKIRLLIKNRSSKPIENVKILEMIPSLVDLVKESYVGTLEPNKIIKNEKKGTLIRWDINYLDPFEERIITYKVKSKLNIIGGITLPATKVKFEVKPGIERSVSSRKFKVKFFN